MSRTAAGIGLVLNFLQTEYRIFHRLSPEEQAQTLARNVEVQQTCASSSTLRDLYLHLMFSEAACAHPDVIPIKRQIKERESMGETVTPDPDLYRAALECRKDDSKFKQVLLGRVPSGRMSRQLERLFRRSPKRSELCRDLIGHFFQHLPKNSLKEEDVKGLVDLIELALLTYSLSESEEEEEEEDESPSSSSSS